MLKQPSQRISLRVFLIAVGLSAIGADPSVAQNDSEQPLQPADVYARVDVLRQELELIRLEMGRPRDGFVQFRVANVAPREVFFQALTLFGKSNQLSYEMNRLDEAAPETPAGEILPKHVYGVVEAALRQLRRVKEKLGIVETATPPAVDPSKTPTDVFTSIVAASRQLNRLLEQQYTPSDVYEQVTLAVGYTSRQVDCFKLVATIARQSDLRIARLSPVDERDLTGIPPSDVYDLATLVVSELAYLPLTGCRQPIPGARLLPRTQTTVPRLPARWPSRDAVDRS